MKKFLKKTAKKLKSDLGDSIAEVLIALLISSVALVMLASMISSSTSMIDSSKKNISDYYIATNSLTGSAAPSYSGTARLVSSDSTVITSVSVNYYVNDNINNHPVVTFEKTNP